MTAPFGGAIEEAREPEMFTQTANHVTILDLSVIVGVLVALNLWGHRRPHGR